MNAKPSAGAASLVLSNVSAGYGSGDVIRNISFELPSSGSLIIIGPNGCGKTTLLKCIAQLIPYRGAISLGSKELSACKRSEIAAEIALMSQVSSFYFPYDVYSTVMLGRYLHIGGAFARPSEHDHEAVKKCLEAVDMLKFSKRIITELSGGELQRVFLARTLAQEPRIILLDEPTNHLDLKYQAELMEFLKEWSKHGSHTVLGVLHDINLALRFGSDLMLLSNGEIAAFGSAADVLGGEKLMRAYGMDVADYMKNTLAAWHAL